MNTINGKPVARLEEWSIWTQGAFGLTLRGKVYDHPRQADFQQEWQGTSPVVKFFLGTPNQWYVETENVVYQLGKYIGD